MPSNVRVNIGRWSRDVGTSVGKTTSAFGLGELKAAVSGELLAPILLDALEPAKAAAFDEWPRETGASGDSIRTEVAEVGPTFARVALEVGGDPLIADPRNVSKKDYAPYIELNGSPSGRGRGTMLRAMIDNDREIRERIHAGVDRLLAGIAR